MALSLTDLFEAAGIRLGQPEESDSNSMKHIKGNAYLLQEAEMDVEITAWDGDPCFIFRVKVDGKEGIPVLTDATSFLQKMNEMLDNFDSDEGDPPDESGD